MSQQEWNLLQRVLNEQRTQDTEDTPEISIDDMIREYGPTVLLGQVDRESRPQENRLTKIKIMVEILDGASPHDFANVGFFYSHPRMTGLQVHCGEGKD